MFEQLKQVALTYTTRWMFWLFGGFVLACSAPQFLVAARGAQNFDQWMPSMMMGIGFPIYFLCFVIVTQAKRHFAHPRARLMPNFAVPHLVPVVVLSVLSLAGMPWLCSVVGMPLVSTAAYTATLAALIIWALQTNNMVCMLVALGVFYSPFTNAGLDFWGLGTGATISPLARILMVASWVAVLAYPIRLVLLREEDTDFAGQLDVDQFDVTSRGDRSMRQKYAAWSKRSLLGMWRVVDWWHDRIASRRLTWQSHSLGLGEYGFGPAPVWLIAASFATGLSLIAGIVGKGLTVLTDGAAATDPIQILSMPLVLAICVPTFIGFIHMLQRWPRLATELLRPLAREQLIRSYLRAIALNTAQLSATLFAWILAVGCLLAPEWFSAPRIGMILLLAVAVQMLGTAIGLWLVPRLRNWLGYLVHASLVMLLAAGVATWWNLNESLGHAPFLVGACAMMALAAYLWRSAYRTWITVEFGA